MRSIGAWSAWRPSIGTLCARPWPSFWDIRRHRGRWSSTRRLRLPASSPARNRCSSSTECSTAWGGIWKRLRLNSPQRARSSTGDSSHGAIAPFRAGSKPNSGPEESELRLHRDQVWQAGLRDVAAETALVGAVVIGEGNLLKVATGDRADDVKRAIGRADVEQSSVRGQAGIEWHGTSG